jgi:hypothetical protein
LHCTNPHTQTHTHTHTDTQEHTAGDGVDALGASDVAQREQHAEPIRQGPARQNHKYTRTHTERSAGGRPVWTAITQREPRLVADERCHCTGKETERRKAGGSERTDQRGTHKAKDPEGSPVSVSTQRSHARSAAMCSPRKTVGILQAEHVLRPIQPTMSLKTKAKWL